MSLAPPRTVAGVGRSMRVRGSLACVAALLAILVAGALAGPAAASVPVPTSDPFYTPPAGYASTAPGTILRSREVSVVGLTQAASPIAYQLLYRSEDATGQPIAAVTTLLLPAHPSAGPRRLLSYQTAEDSLSLKCAPSYTLQTASGSTQSAESGEIALGLLQGWDVAVPDYEGPQSEYAVGALEGRVTLDGIRAVEAFTSAGLEGASTEVAMMGYSGGSIPSIWANSLARSYAPDVKLVGNAVGGIVPDPIENLVQVNGGPFAGVIIAVSVAVDRAYPSLDLGAILNAQGQALAAQDGVDADGCAGGVTNAPFGTVGEYTKYPTPQALEAVPQVKAAFGELDLIGRAAPEAPSYWWNAINDEIAIIKPVDELYAANCAQGAAIDYYRSPVGEHLTGAGLYAPTAVQYLEGRFAGAPAPDTCPAAARAPAGSVEPACSPLRGRLRGARLGPVWLGETRARARRAFARFSKRRRNLDFFCLNAGRGIEVGYPSARLLRELPTRERARVARRVVLALSANSYYSLDGARSGRRLTRRLAARLHAVRVGAGGWFLTRPAGGARGVLEVKRGVIVEVGVAERALTATSAGARRFFASFF